mmetsp:Transcript_13088/g.34917  ORF Transcript_13088/g.34917 Transcript_13088/m.34917 type:complete len:412 (-) Transcript_13088:508-1743(-)
MRPASACCSRCPSLITPRASVCGVSRWSLRRDRCPKSCTSNVTHSAVPPHQKADAHALVHQRQRLRPCAASLSLDRRARLSGQSRRSSAVRVRWHIHRQCASHLDDDIETWSSSHGHKLFACSWVNGHARIKVLLRGAHLHGHSEALENLISCDAEDVEAHHALILRLDAHKLHGSACLALSDGVVHVDELGRVHLDVVLAILGNGLLLSEAHRANGRVGEDHCGHEVIVELGLGLAVKEAVRELAAGGYGNRGELNLARDVAHCIDPLHVGLLVVINRDVALIGELDTRLVQSEGLDKGLAARGGEETVHVLEYSAVGELDGHDVALLDGLGDLRGAVHLHACLLHFLGERLTDDVVKVLERALAAHHEGHLRAKGLKYASELHGDVAAADDHSPLGLVLELEEAVRVYC